jgi:glycosyltransferase involved in cell wall biosynthesis
LEEKNLTKLNSHDHKIDHPLNVLYFTQVFYPFLFGGGEYIFFLIAKELVKKGHNVHVITQRFQGTQAFEVFEEIKIYRVGPELRYLGILPPTIKHNLKYLISASKQGTELILANRKSSKRIDLIHSNTYVPALSGQVCSSIFNVPHVITFHDVYQAVSNKFWSNWTSTQNANVPFYTSIVSSLVERIVMKLPACTFHTVSDASREDLIAFGIGDKKIKVISNGIDYSQYVYEDNSNHFDDKETTVAFVGRLVFYKNLETVIRAFKKVVEIIPKARLVIVGDGPYRSNLMRESEYIKDNVTFTGRVSSSEKAKIIAKSSFIVFPSLVEGFGISVIEGFACKKPVIVSDVRPLSDIVKDGFTGYVVPPLDVSKWAQKMIYLLNDKAKQKEMGNNAYDEFVSKYEIKMVISKIEMLYMSIINDNYDKCKSNSREVTTSAERAYSPKAINTT